MCVSTEIITLHKNFLTKKLNQNKEEGSITNKT